jgi:hypothetical protein
MFPSNNRLMLFSCRFVRIPGVWPTIIAPEYWMKFLMLNIIPVKCAPFTVDPLLTIKRRA